MYAMRRFISVSVVGLMAFIVSVPVLAKPRPSSPPVNVVVADQPAGSLELVGSNPLNNRGMNAAIAVKGDYAYVGSRTDAKLGNANGAGVLVVDVSDPASPEVVHEIGSPDEGNPGETSRELRIWPEKNLLIVMTIFSNCGEIHGCTPVDGDDRFNFYDISGENAAAPKLVATYEPTVNPHEFFLWDDPKHPGRALLFISTPGGATQLLVTDISKAAEGEFKELFSFSPVYLSGSLHSLSISPDGKRGYMAHLTGGVGVIDTTSFTKTTGKPTVRVLTPPPNAPQWEGAGPHSAVPVWGKDYMLVTDEVYGEALRALGPHGCPWGWVHMVDIADPVKPELVSEYKLPQNDEDFCTTDPPRPFSSWSAHNPTLTKDLAIISWHSGGLQVVDISDPTAPAQAAEWSPTPVIPILQEDPVLSFGQDKVVVWSYPIIQDGLIYVVDVRNGLYILRYTGPYANEVSQTKFLEGNSNLGDALKLGRL